MTLDVVLGIVSGVKKTWQKVRENKMKFYIRRAVAGILAIPFVAGAWVFLYLMLLIIGGEPSQTITETFTNGLTIGVIVAVMFTFSPQFNKFVSFLSGEGK